MKENNHFVIQKKRYLYLLIGIMLLACGYVSGQKAVKYVMGTNVIAEKKTRFCIVIDAGHGGGDPGKIGINGVKEKDVNLQIAKKLEELCKQEGLNTIMTRADDMGFYNSQADNKKVQDMRKRIVLIEKSVPNLTVSIHQNSFPEEYVKGAQVFYYKDSMDSKRAAEIIQKSLKQRIEPENHREAKANTSYYLLKKTSKPTVIVECGFLSNGQEAELLVDEEYQERLAWAIFMGIMQTLNAS